MKSLIYRLLKKSEQLTGTDNIYLAKGGFWLSFNQIGSTLILIVLAILWGRLVPKEVYGQYKFVLSLSGLLAVFSLQGMGSAVARAVARGFDGTLREALKSRFRWSTLAIIAGFFLALYYWWRQNPILAISFLAAGLLSPLINNLPLYLDYLTGKKRFDLAAKYSLLRTVLVSIITLIVILLTKNVVYLVLVHFAANGFLHIFFYKLTLKKLPPSANVDQSGLSFGRHLSVMGVISLIGLYLDKILIFHYLGAAELAIYSFATLLPDHGNGLIKNIHLLALPKLAAREENEIKRTLRKRTIIIALAVGLMVVFYLLTAGLIFRLFFPQYLSSVLYSKIYVVSLLAGVGLIPGATFVAKAKTKILYQYNLTTELIKIAVLFAGVYWFGLMGLVVGYVGYVLVSTAFSFFLFRRMR